MKKKRITIKDVAKKANVSIATVSLVINNNDRITKTTRTKVLNAIKELNYYPSKSAQALVNKKTGNLGFILTDNHFLRTEPFYTRIFLGTEFEAKRSDYYVLLATVKTDYNEGDQIPRFVLEGSVDGIIIAGKIPVELLSELLKFNIPLVCVDYYRDRSDYPVVLIDNIQGGMTATEHLLKLNHKNIAFLGGDIHHPSIADRLIGYKAALHNASININENIIMTDSPYPDRQNGYHSTQLLFEKNSDVTAIFACNDAMAIGAMQFMKDNNISIPNDISLIGFDDVEADLLLDPPLTTIRVPKIDLGVEAVKYLIEIINNKNSTPKKIIVPIELINRSSTKEK
jgi:LacI family transcriptional regulator